MAMSRTQIKELSAVSEQMRSMAQEMREFADRGTQPVTQAGAHKAVERPAVLQINQTGAWRTALDVDFSILPPEFLDQLDQVLRLGTQGDKASARFVIAEPGANGRPVATRTVLMDWSRQKGWVNS